MSESAIRAKIKTTMEGVSSVGVVHDYERYARSLEEFFKLMSEGGIVNGWVIHRQSTTSTRVLIGGQVERQHVYSITGLYQLNDVSGSEKTFQGILDALFAAFAADGTIGGTAISHDQFQIDNVTTDHAGDHGDNLFHMADCTLAVTERVTI